MNKDRVKTLLTLVILILGLVVGYKFGQRSATTISIPEGGNKLDAILDYAQRNYVDSISIPDLVEKAIPEVLAQLDPFSVYISAKAMDDVNESLQGNFDGIGITFNMATDTIMVINAITGGPSERVGIQAGDRIIKVDDLLVAGVKYPQDSVVKMLRGKAGTTVKVDVMRVGVKNLIPFTITRAQIPIKSVDVAYMVNENTGYIKMSKFSSNTHKEFVNAIDRLHGEGMTKVIVDLRDNSGGYLDQANKIANEFLPKDAMIVYTEGRARKRRDYRSTGRGRCLNDEVIIIINEFSASASEILAGAIQDNDRGTIVGRRSYGKGLVQEQHSFSDGSGFRLTIAHYYTPTGRSIQRPYDKGNDDYFLDIMRRYEHKEFEEADSIPVNDSLRYETPKGKIVYGGGGIVPDVFVPIDTTSVTSYFKELVGKNLIYSFAMNFVDKHRAELNGIKTLPALKQLFTKYNLLSDFQAYASSSGVLPKGNELNESKDIILAQLKAFIGRSTPLDDEGFYPFIAIIDSTMQKASELAKKGGSE